MVIGCDLAPVMTGGELATLVECRFCLAKSLDQVGDASLARSILEANLKTLDNVRITNPTAADGFPGQRYSRSLINSFGLGDIDDLGADDWADRVTKFLSSILGTGTIDPGEESELVYSLTQLHCGAAASQRRAGKLDEARRTTDRILALAKLMISRYPDEPAAHLSLRAALMQRAKDAWEIDDRVTVEWTWKLALEEARHAGSIPPTFAPATLSPS